MTTQIVGFGDEISTAEVEAMTAEVSRSASGRRQALDPVRVVIREATANTVRVHQLDDEPQGVPHISVAYSNASGPAAPVIEALAGRPLPCRLTVRQVHLVAQVRDGHLYRWEPCAALPLGG